MDFQQILSWTDKE